MINENIPTVQTKDIQLTATLPHEMVESQNQLINWTENKLKELQLEEIDLRLAYEHAKKCKWKWNTLYNQHQKSVKKIEYYEKLHSALLHDYYIVPNFPIQMFAIKTDRKFPSGHKWQYWGDFEQDAKELPQNEGEYKNPFPVIKRNSEIYKDGKTVRNAASWADDWDKFEFPLMMAKPQIMEATSRAMALKVFDQIGIMPAAKKEDPVIIGQIIRKSGNTKKIISFMIAWHLNTNVL